MYNGDSAASSAKTQIGRTPTLRPFQISPDTAVKLAKALNVPIERLMHMPQHILMQKLMELSKQEADAEAPADKEQKP